MMKIISVLFFIVLSGVIQAGNVYYVSNANDVSDAMDVAQPGDTLIMTNGVWFNQNIIFEGFGAADNNIVLRAEEPGSVILNGTSTLRISGRYLTVDGLYFFNGYSSSGGVIEFRNGSSKPANKCRLTNTAIVDYNPASAGSDYKWVSLYGDSNRVDHCYLKGKRHNGTTLVIWLDGTTNYHLVDSNYFAYRPELGVNGGETIRVGTSDYSLTDSYTTVEYNYFERCNGETEIISNKSGHNTYRYNTFYESEGTLTLRHGNFAEVYNNFFIGNNKERTGGVRVIGEDHKVFNNYFENLEGTGFRAALPIMNGVPNSPLNRYYQVKRAEIVNNTFVDCDETFVIGAGSDGELSLPPLDCIIANNIAVGSSRLIEYEDDPINLVYEANIMDGLLGIPPQEGLIEVDPELYFADDSLWRIPDGSPAVDSASLNYTYVKDDMDGQIRGANLDIGSDEYSNDPILRKPLTGKDVGPYWYPPPPPPVQVIRIAAGQDSLMNAINFATERDIIELTTSGGIYPNSQVMKIEKTVRIRAAAGLDEMPVIQMNSSDISTRMIFEMHNFGRLFLKGVELDGMSASSTPTKYLIRTDDAAIDEPYNLYIDSCYFHDVSVESNGNFFRAYEGTKADSIVIKNSLFTNSGKEGIRLRDEDTGSGNYNVEYFELTNCTFWNIPREAVYIYGGDDVIFTPGPEIVIDHCTFDNCGYDGTRIIYPDDCDKTTIKNSILSNSPNSISLSLYSVNSEISFSDLFNVGDVELVRNANFGNRIIDWDPLFTDAAGGDFTLPSNSPVLNRAEDGSSQGDVRWAVNPRNFFTLNLETSGEGSVNSNPETQGLNYDPGTMVTLTATAAEGYMFVEWTGDITTTESIVQINMDADKSVTAVFDEAVSVEVQAELPLSYNLSQNYPNPFNPSTRIDYSIPVTSHLSIDIYDISGRHVTRLIDSEHSPGNYNVYWTPEMRDCLPCAGHLPAR